jgi:hypothetical protein
MPWTAWEMLHERLMILPGRPSARVSQSGHLIGQLYRGHCLTNQWTATWNDADPIEEIYLRIDALAVEILEHEPPVFGWLTTALPGLSGAVALHSKTSPVRLRWLEQWHYVNLLTRLDVLFASSSLATDTQLRK